MDIPPELRAHLSELGKRSARSPHHVNNRRTPEQRQAAAKAAALVRWAKRQTPQPKDDA